MYFCTVKLPFLTKTTPCYVHCEEDFLKFKDDKEMAEVMKRLKKDNWSVEEYKYVSDMDSYHLFWANQEEENNKKWERRFANREKRYENALVVERLKAEQERFNAVEAERLKAEQERLKAKEFQRKLIFLYVQNGNTIPMIAD
jgi:5'-deoxynucleotidase YfbR-like HD superfamily hydrolase